MNFIYHKPEVFYLYYDCQLRATVSATPIVECALYALGLLILSVIIVCATWGHATELSVAHLGLFGQVIYVAASPRGHVHMVHPAHIQWTQFLIWKLLIPIFVEYFDFDNFRARSLGKTAALVSNFCPNASDSQLVG